MRSFILLEFSTKQGNDRNLPILKIYQLRQRVRKKRHRNPSYISFDPKIRNLRRRQEREYGQVLFARGLPFTFDSNGIQDFTFKAFESLKGI